MRDKLVGGLAVLMGGSALYRWLNADPAVALAHSAAYNAGYTTSTVVFGVVFLVAGLYYLFRKS